MPTMLMVSCRRDFWSPTEFSSDDQIRRIDLETGTGTTASQADLIQEVAGKRVTVIVHGYNNEETDVVKSYRTIDAHMRELGLLGTNQATYNVLVGFVWPGGAVGVSFPFARQRAGESASRLARLLGQLRTADATLDLNTHSLGAHVALEALRQVPVALIRNAWNFASAVDNESIESGERYFAATRRCERFYVFHSKNDPVLRTWYRIGDLFDFDTALGYSGPEDPAAIMSASDHVRVVNCKDVVTSHGGYRSAGQVWAYMSRELTNPSEAQFVTLSRSQEMIAAVFRVAGGTTIGRAAKTVSPAAKDKRRPGRHGGSRKPVERPAPRPA